MAAYTSARSVLLLDSVGIRLGSDSKPKALHARCFSKRTYPGYWKALEGSYESTNIPGQTKPRLGSQLCKEGEEDRYSSRFGGLVS